MKRIVLIGLALLMTLSMTFCNSSLQENIQRYADKNPKVMSELWNFSPDLKWVLLFNEPGQYQLVNFESPLGPKTSKLASGKYEFRIGWSPDSKAFLTSLQKRYQGQSQLQI